MKTTISWWSGWSGLGLRCLLTLSFATVSSGCATTYLDCGIPRPNDDAIAEMIEEAERSIALRDNPDGPELLQPGVHLWHKDILRSCDW